MDQLSTQEIRLRIIELLGRMPSMNTMNADEIIEKAIKIENYIIQEQQ